MVTHGDISGLTLGVEAFAALIMLLFGSLTSFVCKIWLWVRLRRRHEEVWIALGRPSVASRSRDSFDRMYRYFAERRHVELGDERLNRIARIDRLASATNMLGLVIMLVAVLRMAWSAF